VLYAVARRHPRPGHVTALYLVLYAVVRFHTERLRGDARLQVGTLSISQIVSLLLLVIGIGVLLALWMRRRRADPPAA
jgi:phosphatidylglycerol:prolipoprotein diacylglycerol transferase